MSKTHHDSHVAYHLNRCACELALTWHRSSHALLWRGCACADAAGLARRLPNHQLAGALARGTGSRRMDFDFNLDADSLRQAKRKFKTKGATKAAAKTILKDKAANEQKKLGKPLGKLTGQSKSQHSSVASS